MKLSFPRGGGVFSQHAFAGDQFRQHVFLLLADAQGKRGKFSQRLPCGLCSAGGAQLARCTSGARVGEQRGAEAGACGRRPCGLAPRPVQGWTLPLARLTRRHLTAASHGCRRAELTAHLPPLPPSCATLALRWPVCAGVCMRVSRVLPRLPAPFLLLLLFLSSTLCGADDTAKA